MSIAQAGETPVLIGPYRITRVLGEGGMGVVYEGVHGQTGEPAAVKTVRAHHEHQLAGIRREILALSRLHHPGVVRVIATGLNEAVPWYAMELLEGETLMGLKDRGFAGSWSGRSVSGVQAVQPPLPQPSSPDQPTIASTSELDSTRVVPRKATLGEAAAGRLREMITVVRRLCNTLSYLHGEGVVHRDLKPSNIFVRPGFRPVLVDFGLVWGVGGAGREVLDVGLFEAGTVGYMAPELFRGEMSDARADLYALGCILFEMLTGRLPFEGGSLLEIRSGHLALTPPLPSSLVEGVPPELDALVMGLLEKQPRQRIGHASDVERVLAGLGAEADAARRGPDAKAYVYRPELSGREPAMNTLREAFDRSVRADGSMVLVGGESGIGKTYLVVAFARQAMARGYSVVADSCAASPAEGPGSAPLLPFRKLLQTVADRCVAMGPAATTMLLGPSLHLLAPYEPSLTDLPGADMFPPPPELSAQAARKRLVEAVQGVIRAFVEFSPLLLLLDDIQWIDDLSAQVLSGLDPQSFRARLLIIATYRTEERSPHVGALLAHPKAIPLQLSRLDEETVGVLIRDMLATDPAPGALVKFLTSRCKGNPFFVAEYLRAAVAEGLLTRVNGRWSVNSAGDEGVAIALPGTLSLLVQHRLRGLSKSARELLEGAAVLGKECSLPRLERLIEMPDEARLEALRELLQAQLLEEDTERLRLHHDKLREVTYEAIPPQRRAALHLQAARLLEELPGVEPKLLASHFAQGNEPIRAIEFLELAGDAALKTFSNREAIECFEQALQLDQRASAERPASWEASLGELVASRLDRDGPLSGGSRRKAAALRRARWYRLIAEAQFAQGDLNGCLDACTRGLQLLGFGPPSSTASWALDLLRQTASQVSRRMGLLRQEPLPSIERACMAEAALLLQRLSERFYYHFDALPMLSASLASVNLAADADADVSVARPYGMLGMTVGISKMPRLGSSYFEQARAMARRTGDLDGLAFALYAEAVWHIGVGQWARVKELSDQALAIASDRGNLHDVAMCKTLLAHVDFYTGHFEKSRDLFAELARESRARNNPQTHAWGLYAGARALVPLGDLPQARAMLDEAHALLDPLADVPSKIICSGLLAMACAHLGDRAAAASAAASASARIRKSLPTVFSTVDGYAGVAEAQIEALDGGSPWEARRAVFDLMMLAVNIPIGWPYYHRLQGLLLQRTGDRRGALRAWRKARDSAAGLAMPFERARATLLLAGAASRGSLERAALLDDAERAFEKIRCKSGIEDARSLR